MHENPNKIPAPGGQLYLTEGGIETHMQYKKGYEIPHFCLFDLMKNPKAVADLRAYHERIIEVALEHKVGAILDGVHYRSSKDWGELLGYSPAGLAEIVAQGIEFYRELAREYENENSPMPVSGVVGPRGDAYSLGRTMSADDAEEYHDEQIATMKSAGADMITALTFSHVDEAIGLVRAAKAHGMPVVVSFTLGSNGKLKTGTAFGDAIETIDLATDDGPDYYMINCTHPIDFAPAFNSAGDWTTRLGGIRPNASSLDHGMLCQLGHLEEGDPDELSEQMADMARCYPHLNVWGGCCGTDFHHIDRIVTAVKAARFESEPTRQ